MSSLVRTILIGLAAGICAVALLAGIVWFGGTLREETLAARLPATSVLAYVTLPDEKTARLLASIAPSLPPLPESTEPLRALAAVRAPNGTEGWIAEREQPNGRPRFTGTSPDLETILSLPDPTLDTDSSYRRLRWQDDDHWMYLAFPRLSPNDSSIGTFTMLDSPLAIRTDTGVTLRLLLSPSLSGRTWNSRSLVSLPDAHILAIPAWDDLPRLGALLTDNARLTIGALARGFVASSIDAVSLPYDLAPLLQGPSLLHLRSEEGDRGFAFEGIGRNAPETDRILRLLHERVASSYGHAETQTVDVRGHTLTTLLPGERPTTTERTDSGWTILETRGNDRAFMSIQNGTRFAFTNRPDALTQASDDAVTPITRSTIGWNDAERFLRPLLPALQPAGEDLTIEIRSAPGIVEWSLGPLQGL